MNEQPKDDCCKGCQNGQPGKNPSCQAKIMLQKIESNRQQAKNEA